MNKFHTSSTCDITVLIKVHLTKFAIKVVYILQHKCTNDWQTECDCTSLCVFLFLLTHFTTTFDNQIMKSDQHILSHSLLDQLSFTHTLLIQCNRIYGSRSSIDISSFERLLLQYWYQCQDFNWIIASGLSLAVGNVPTWVVLQFDLVGTAKYCYYG